MKSYEEKKSIISKLCKEISLDTPTREASAAIISTKKSMISYIEELKSKGILRSDYNYYSSDEDMIFIIPKLDNLDPHSTISVEDLIQFLKPAILRAEFRRLLGDDGSLYENIQDKYKEFDKYFSWEARCHINFISDFEAEFRFECPSLFRS